MNDGRVPTPEEIATQEREAAFDQLAIRYAKAARESHEAERAFEVAFSAREAARAKYREAFDALRAAAGLPS